MSKSLATTTFDYTALDKDTAGKLRTLAAQIRKEKVKYVAVILETGSILATAHELLANHGDGTYHRWIETECGFCRRTADNYLNSWTVFKDQATVAQSFTPTAMYLLASKSTAPAAVKEAIKLADKGVQIDEPEAKEIVAKHKPPATHSPPARPLKKTNQEPPAEETKEGECPKGGDHEWDKEACKKCHEPKPKPAKPEPPKACNHDWQSDGNGGRFCEKCGEVIEPPSLADKIKEHNSTIESFCRELTKFFKDNCPHNSFTKEHDRYGTAGQQIASACGTLRQAQVIECPCCKDGCAKCKHTRMVTKGLARQLTGASK